MFQLTELCEYEQTAKLLENQEQIYREEKAEVEQRLEELTEKEVYILFLYSFANFFFFLLTELSMVFHRSFFLQRGSSDLLLIEMRSVCSVKNLRMKMHNFGVKENPGCKFFLKLLRKDCQGIQ